jgi:hypothetical protein
VVALILLQIKSEVNIMKLTLSAKVVEPEERKRGSEESTPAGTPSATLGRGSAAAMEQAGASAQGASMPPGSEPADFELDENRTLTSILGQEQTQDQ